MISKLLLLILSIYLPFQLISQDGQLDPGFGDKNGWLHTDFGAKDQAGSVAIQKDGKLVVGGRTNLNGSFDFILARYFSDGTLDLNFGDRGKVIRDFGSTQENIEFIKILNDNKILVGGFSGNSPNSTGVLFRLLPDGSPDLNFGNQGQVLFKFGRSTGASAVAIQEDDKIVVACVAVVDSLDIDWLVTRFYPDGQLDSSFNLKGWTYFNFLSREDIPFDIVIQKNHKILVTGCAGVYPKANFAFLRLNEDGSFDNSFGSNGSMQTDFNSDQDVAYTSVILDDGKIVTSGTVRDSLTSYNFALARYLEDGSPDLSFGHNGKMSYDFNGPVDYGLYMIKQPDGKYLVCGLVNVLTHNSYVVVRFNQDGSLDTGFGKNGIASLDVVNILTDNTPSFAMQDDGKIVMVANYKDGTNVDFLVMRFLNSFTTDNQNFNNQSVQLICRNPVGEDLLLHFNKLSGNTELQLFDLNGKMMNQKEIAVDSDSWYYNWKQNLKPGNYYLKWHHLTKDGVLKLIKN